MIRVLVIIACFAMLWYCYTTKDIGYACEGIFISIIAYIALELIIDLFIKKK